MITVWIVARLPLIREGLGALLASQSDLSVTVPSTSNPASLAGRLSASPPDAILLDIDVLEAEGWGFLSDLTTAAPGVAVVVVGELPDDLRIGRTLDLGARGYISRDSSGEEFATALRAARRGLYVLTPGAVRALRTPTGDDSSPRIRGDEDDSLVEPLSPRELEVLRLLARGMANKQIGAELFITEHTVKFHIRSILGKLGASNRTEAVTLGIQKGLVAI